jgi:predicted nucleic acid-binding protein
VLALDTSALVKRYLDEDGREEILALMAGDRTWVASRLARVETDIALCRAIDDPQRLATYRAALATDWNRFTVIATDDACMARAAQIGCELGIRTLDAIHLAATDGLPRNVTFVSYDRRLRLAANRLGIAVEPRGRS